MSSFQKVRSFQQLDEIFEAFTKTGSTLSTVIVVGPPGVGKSTRRRQIDGAYVLECTTTPFGLYQSLYENKEAGVIVLDDVDTLLTSPTGINLLKALLQSDAIKTIQWNTVAADRAKIPRSFQTRARVLVLANSIKGVGANFQAVLDRAHCYRFSPTATEVHQRATQSMAHVVDQQVFDFIGENLPIIMRPSFRDYVKATQQKRAGLDWRTSLKSRWQKDPKLVAMAEILHLARKGDPDLQSVDQRVARFEAQGMGARSTFFEYQTKTMDMLGMKKLPRKRRKRMADNTVTATAVITTTAATAEASVTPPVLELSVGSRSASTATNSADKDRESTMTSTEQRYHDMFEVFIDNGIDPSQIGAYADGVYERLMSEGPSEPPSDASATDTMIVTMSMDEQLTNSRTFGLSPSASTSSEVAQ